MANRVSLLHPRTRSAQHQRLVLLDWIDEALGVKKAKPQPPPPPKPAPPAPPRRQEPRATRAPTLAGRTLADWGVILDLDGTVVASASIADERLQGTWRTHPEETFARTRLSPGVREFLAQLLHLGIGHGVVTRSRRDYAEALLAFHELGELPVLVAYGETAHGKPHPEPIRVAAKSLGVSAFRCICVGDEVADRWAALAAGALSESFDDESLAHTGGPRELWSEIGRTLEHEIGRSPCVPSAWPALLAAYAQRYDPSEMCRNILCRWTRPANDQRTARGEDLALFNYNGVKSGEDATSRFIHGFKDGQPWAQSLAQDLVFSLFEANAVLFRDIVELRYVVTVPRSCAERPQGAELLAAQLAARFPWLQHIQGGLRRIAPVRESRAGDRVSEADHHASINFAPGRISPSAKRYRVLLLDDIITRGTVTSACRQRVIDGFSPAPIGVPALTIGRTYYDPTPHRES